MLIYRHIGLFKAWLSGAVCAATLGVFAAADDFTYQSLTNLGPCASSRVLLMNNDTNPTCPIQGQGYHDTSNTVAVGQTYWWHDDTPFDEKAGSTYISTVINLQTGINHILYQKRGGGLSPLKLWELVNCRAGSAALRNAAYNYLPWSSTCQPIDEGAYSAPISDEWTQGNNSNGVRQVAVITMRATTDAAIFSPFYEDGIGEVYFDVVNFTKNYISSHIAVEVATELDGSQDDVATFGADTSTSLLKWEKFPCEVYSVTKGGGIEEDSTNFGQKEIRLHGVSGFNNQYFRVRVPVNIRGAIRFRIVRTDVHATTYRDYQDIILVDNIIVSYPTPSAKLSPTGIDANGDGFANIGKVGAFTEPLLSAGLGGAKPRMTFSADTNGLPPFIDWKASATSSDFVWRWKYLEQAYGPWATNKMSLAEGGDMLVGDAPIDVTNRVGDIEYYYIADVTGTHYKFFDYANDTQVELPESATSSIKVRYPDTDSDPSVSNYWSRIRAGASPWQEMHLEALVITNAENVLVVTNDWTMELISDHMWRGFLYTPTNYEGKVAHFRFRGRSMWETNGIAPSIAERTWYFPIGAVEEIPMGAVAVTDLGEHDEQDVVLDASSGYLVFEFNDESGAFTLNRAEYQDFNRWTPQAGQEENKYIGDYVNTSYVGRAKQEYTLDVGNWPMSRSTSSYWWENFDAMAGNKDYPFNAPFDVERTTPNGWAANHAMYVCGLFATNGISSANLRTYYGMALQLKGRGLGTISLVDPPDVPQGIGTVSFTARLAQYLEFGDFLYYVDGTTKTNYAITAKAVMTNHRRKYCDISNGSPSISLVAYYRPGKGCYEFRITRTYSTWNNLWDANGAITLEIYKWTPDAATGTPQPKLLASQRVTNNYLVPADSGSLTTDNDRWWSVYIAAYNVSGTSTYIEAGVAKAQNSNAAYTDLGLQTSANMSVVSFTDTDSPLTKGSYGVCTRECPGAFGNIQYHKLNGKPSSGYYKNPSSGAFSGLFQSCPEGSEKTEDSWRWIEKKITDGDWGSLSRRVVKWSENTERTYTGTYTYGLCAAPVSQKIYLKTSPHGNSKDWTDTGLDLTLTSYITNSVTFSPHITIPVNMQISVGGSDGDPRTDVVVDNLQLSQWKGDSSSASSLGSMTSWAYTDAWIAGSTNDVYQGTGAEDDSDPAAYITKCGYYVKQLNDTEFIYVFTNTTAGALGTYATFIPKFDMTIKELFVLGGGGGGGPGGGGGGGGDAIWVTNSVDYTAGEGGIQVYVGNGGSGGTARYSNNNVQPSGPGNGGQSYVWIKNPLKTTEMQQYRGYGGYRGGWFYNHSTANTRNTNNAGSGSSSGGSAGGGSALITAGHVPTSTTIMNASRHTYGREIYGAGYGGAAVDGAPGGGGGGGLRGIAPGTGSNYGAGTAAKPTSVIYAGEDGEDGTGDATGGKGGDGFPLSMLGESEVRYAIGELLGDNDAWLGGGGGGGSGRNTVANTNNWGRGAYSPGSGGRWSGGMGGYYTAGSYNSNYTLAMGRDAVPFSGGGGGGGTFNNPVTSGNSAANNWIIGGGKGASGLVVMHVKVKDRFVMLQPMRGAEKDPMSVRSVFMNGLSLLSFSWRNADSNAVLKVQIATNGVDETSIRTISQSLSEGWTDIGDPIRFSGMSDAVRLMGSTNILIGLRAPISGVVRLLVDPDVVADARKGSTNDLYSWYGTVVITGMKALDEPELDDRSWWGWNIMPTYAPKWSSLYDPVTLGPGRSCGLNFTGVVWTNALDAADNDQFADDITVTSYTNHHPFIQTPRFTNRIGTVSFKARVTETNLSSSGWVTISACDNPGQEDDAKWDVLTNIEVTASTTIFEPFSWRLPSSQSDYQALRLTAWGAAKGRYNSEETHQPFGDANSTTNPTPIQRVLIDEVLVTQPMEPKLAFVNAYPYRHGTTSEVSLPASQISSPDEQPLLGEMFGVQVQVLSAGMEDELDVDSIKVYLAWYADDDVWGYRNWKSLPAAMKKVELKRASDWSDGNLVYRSNPADSASYIPAQFDERSYKFVQYHIWAEYKNKNGIEYTHDLSAKEWRVPEWYRGISDPNSVNGGAFSAYTVLDTISPKRAWINEINTFDGSLLDSTHQFIEVAVPQGFDMIGWSLHCIKNDGIYDLKNVAYFGYNGVASNKMANAHNSYAFIAVQSPATSSAGSYPGVNDGSWMSSAFEGGVVDVANPYALCLRRPTGIIEHEVVFMSTNTSTSRAWYTYEGTNLLNNLKASFPNSDWVYAGGDSYSSSLGVFTNHGESASCWTNTMQQTPGKVNLTASGQRQTIDPNYFEPPSGNFLWVYANVAEDSQNAVSVVVGAVTNASAVLIVPQSGDGSFSTSVVYVVKNWFELDSVVTNELGKAAAEVAGAEGKKKLWTLNLNGLKMSSSESRRFSVVAAARDSSRIAALGSNGVSKDDPYYPAVVDWLQNFEEDDIRLAEFWQMNDKPVKRLDGSNLLLTLKEMYWLDIPPVSSSGAFGNSEWVFKGGMGSGATPSVQTNVTDGGYMTNIRVAVSMMISNRTTNVAHPPNHLNGLAPGSTSSNYNERAAANTWTSVTFKVTGALQNGIVDSVYRPLRWFTFGQNSFTNGFTRFVDIRDPFLKSSIGYSYDWDQFPGCQIFYRWRIDDDTTNRPPITVYQLNDENALFGN